METAGLDAEQTREARTPARSHLLERRREPRFVPVINHAYLAWREGAACHAEAGWLQNISAGGAALDVEADPGPGATAWLCVVCPKRTSWVSARVLQRHGRVVRMQFIERLPHETFVAVVAGAGDVGPFTQAHLHDSEPHTLSA